MDGSRAGNALRLTRHHAMDGGQADFNPRVLGSNPSRRHKYALVNGAMYLGNGPGYAYGTTDVPPPVGRRGVGAIRGTPSVDPGPDPMEQCHQVGRVLGWHVGREEWQQLDAPGHLPPQAVAAEAGVRNPFPNANRVPSLVASLAQGDRSPSVHSAVSPWNVSVYSCAWTSAKRGEASAARRSSS